jgi:hypothetical protein
MNLIGNTIRTLGLMGALGVAAMMTGCNSSAGLDADAGSGVVISGQVAGSMAAATEGDVTVVTTHEVEVDGTVGPVVDSTQASADGTFEIRTRLRGEKALIVRAKRAGQEFRARFQNRIEGGSTYALGVLDGFTTLDAQAWVELRKTAEGRAIISADIRAAVEAYVDSVGIAGLTLDSATREVVIARLVLMAKARGHLRAAAISDVIAHADSARPPRDSGDTAKVHPRPGLNPCERAAFLIAAMDPEHPDYDSIRARFATACLDQDTVPPTPQVCRELKARLDGMVEADSTVAAGLGLRAAAHCRPDLPPPPHLTRCERAAIRLVLMDPTRPAYLVLKARFDEHCLDADPTDDAEVDVE